MKQFARWLVACLPLVLVSAIQADDKSPGTKSSSTEPQMRKSGEVLGKFAKIDSEVITLKTQELGSSSSTSARSSRRPQMVEKQHQFDLADKVQIRWHQLPKMPDGKTRQYPPDELKALREPVGTPGYKAEKNDLKPGMIVRLTLSKANPKADPVVTMIMIEADAPPAPASKNAKTPSKSQ